ncbi:HNH endonuclease signature motif containing protein [Latilactobacillus sakei]|uniref:HNH endonuclease signature motif containing protein n=1 Tax=Latilactobacillus sakei TaxID=1599 RepID=UPI0020307BB4|nr:HNH endonuclease signature motif containing protein [Latilactobacillus sakei]MCM1636263.1 HNH endonuclease [Latilactobacillus sakei]
MKKSVRGIVVLITLLGMWIYPSTVNADVSQTLHNSVAVEKSNNIGSQSLTDANLSRVNPEAGQPVIASGEDHIKPIHQNNESNGVNVLAEVPVTNINWHLSEEYVGGDFRINFWIDSIEGITPAAVDAQVVFNSEPTLRGPVKISVLKDITKVGGIKTGLLGSADIPAKTTFFNVSGAVGFAGYNGSTSIKPITPTPIYLQNKIGQNFPEYVDVTSKKDAESPLDTRWTKLGASPKWTTQDRYNFIKTYSETYGNQSQAFWNTKQVHHIRPRIYGGTNVFTNLMPVPTPQHQLITQWFINY